MSEPVTVELVFVELSADTEGVAKRRVDEALGALRISGWGVTRALPDPDRASVWGVEVIAPPNTLPDAGWDVAHALAEHLRADAEAVLRATLDEPEVLAEFPQPFALQPELDVLEERPPEWHLDAIRARGAWAKSTGAGVRIGHPDTGATAHPELGVGRIRLDLGKNLLGDGDPIDPLDELGQPGHGTSTASLMVSPAGCQIDGCRPVSGLAPDAEVVPIRVTNSVVILAWQSRLAEAIEHAVKRGCKVVSMSLGGLGGLRLRRAVREARRAGVVVVAAAGNYVQFVVWPAAYPEVLGVAATGPDGRPWWGSSKGSPVDIAAPGAGVDVARWNKWLGERRAGVGSGNGTSYATALVAAAAALWLSLHRDEIAKRYDPVDVHDAFRTVLRKTAQPLKTGRLPQAWFGAGLLDCEALLAAELPSKEEIERTMTAQEAPGAWWRKVDLEAVLLPLAFASGAPDAEGEAPAVRRDLVALHKQLSPGLAAELLQHTILDRELRQASLGSPALSFAADSPPPIPKFASQRLRAALEGSPAGVAPAVPATVTAPATVTVTDPVIAPVTAPQDQAVQVRLNIEVEIRIGAVRVDYAPGVSRFKGS
jgi:hypothetical protein